MKNILLLGATGSIGKSVLCVISQNDHNFNLYGISFNKNIVEGDEIIKNFSPSFAHINHREAFEKQSHNKSCNFINGDDSFEDLIKNDDIEKYEVVRGGIAYFDNTIIFVDAYGQIKSINISNSKINWETQIDFPILSAPLIYRDQVFFISADNRIFSLSFKTGEILWSFQTIEESKKNLFTASPVAIENIVIAPFSNGEIIAFKYDDGQPVWSENTSKISIISNFDLRDITANPVISGNSIFSLSSNCLLYTSDAADEP